MMNWKCVCNEFLIVHQFCSHLLFPLKEDEILVRLNELFKRYSGVSSPFDVSACNAKTVADCSAYSIHE